MTWTSKPTLDKVYQNGEEEEKEENNQIHANGKEVSQKTDVE